MKATIAGWTPHWFSQYRFYLSLLVGTCILGTLFGVNYLGPTTDVTLAKDFKETGVLGSSASFMDAAIRQDYESTNTKLKRYAPGDAQYWTKEGRDGFVRIMKKSEDGEGVSNSEDDGKGNPLDGEKNGEGEGIGAAAGSGDDTETPGGQDEDESKNPRAGGSGENIGGAKEKQEEYLKRRGGISNAKFEK